MSKMAHLGPHLYSEDDSAEFIDSASEIFEIDDFTSPSPWEKFVSQLEQLFREWGLHKKRSSVKKVPLQTDLSEVNSWPWKCRSSVLSFYEFEFNITEFSRRDPNAVPAEKDQDESDEEENSR
jgi:hypothetical protein